MPTASGRELVADAYRRANLAYRPFFEDTRLWAELTPALATKILEAAELAAGVDRSWRREMARKGTLFVSCIWGQRGEPPFGVRNCEGHEEASRE